MIKVIICGGRDFNDFAYLTERLDHLLQSRKAVEIVSGGARGADTLGEQWASETSHQVKQFLADWNKHGRSAGYKRNEQMADYATHCVAFWDGRSRGTMHMINLAREAGLRTVIYNY